MGLALGCVGAHGQTAQTAPVAIVEAPPRARIDVDFSPIGGIEPVGTGVRGSAAGAIGVRVVTRSGFGGAVGFTGAGDLSLSTTNVALETAHPEGWLFDAAATYRLRPIGDDRRGMGVDLSVGASLANLGWDPGRPGYDRACGLFEPGCSPTVTMPYVSPEPTYTTGARAGPLASLSVDGRLRGLVFGLGVAWRALVYYGHLAPIAAEPVALHVFTVNLHVGFGFSL